MCDTKDVCRTLVRAVLVYKAEELSNAHFCQLMKLNQACLISNLTDRWKSQEWLVPDTGEVNVPVLEELFGDCIVPVADCQRSEYGSQLKRDMTMKEYMQYWRSYQRPRITEDAWGSIERDNCLYLKDWHMQRDVPHYLAYEIPEYFASDWLNEYWREKREGHDDYRFVYIGPQGSWTPLHCDVFGSYSWSGNVCGQKLWLLLPPGEEQYYCDCTGKLACDLTEIDHQHFPKAREHQSEFGGPIRIRQNPGDVIFVPSGWHHQVLNVTDTISINHNWFNAHNLHFIFDRLCAAEAEVMNELSFLQGDEDFEAQVEIVLRAHHGMNRQDFREILTFIAEKRTQQGLNTASPDSILDLEYSREYLKDEPLTKSTRSTT
ncbi:jmjC domain-containing protein 4-like [Varroa jacobsoni]|uniref:jmjC domain-containing protein 4-like n=1 Tax=Varroa jacobsoni TaxID=62625 RepID=UPI000BF399AF|nr:jmjC domain-containing protein 4-like [Varroa jacobsoni]XP_022701569.1 jmjC domain-containing protein 4-like [Varroa jacobsoni]XP_022701570.1 jmjC domain-containing protein 4-like [Varroa jacobsoni]XP_022701571.1 jmjC domain-containing protein 4-like [Varroa jacobsoni]